MLISKPGSRYPKPGSRALHHLAKHAKSKPMLTSKPGSRYPKPGLRALHHLAITAKSKPMLSSKPGSRPVSDGSIIPTLRASPYPEVTDPICRLPLPTLFYRPEAIHLGDLQRLWVQACLGSRPVIAAVGLLIHHADCTDRSLHLALHKAMLCYCTAQAVRHHLICMKIWYSYTILCFTRCLR